LHGWVLVDHRGARRREVDGGGARKEERAGDGRLYRRGVSEGKRKKDKSKGSTDSAVHEADSDVIGN